MSENDEQSHIEDMFVNKGKGFFGVPKPGQYKKGQLVPVYSFDELKKKANETTLKHMEVVMNTVPDRPYPTELDEFNYAFDKEGKLVNKTTGGKFHWVNQRHYDALGDIIYKHIQKMMMKDFGYTEHWLPNGEKDQNTPQCFKTNIFMSPGALENPDKLMLLIQGSGAVRPGQWARALCINDSLQNGAIFEYLKRAKDEGYGVIVFNPNNNFVKASAKEDEDNQTQENKKAEESIKKGAQSLGKAYFLQPDLTKEQVLEERRRTQFVKIKNHSDPGEHVSSVVKQFVTKANAKELYIVAHSAGGYHTVDLLDECGKDLFGRLKAIAFTDAVHSVSGRNEKATRDFLAKNAINWVTSDLKLDSKVPDHPIFGNKSGCLRLSAGHDTHEYTSAFCIDSAFKFLKSKSQI